MKQDEWLVEVDHNDNVVGRVERKVAHDPTHLRLHREVMVLIFTDKSKNHYWLQKRSLKKDQYPGFWTLSATGHVEVEDGEDENGYLVAAKRETMEEMGLILINEKLVGKTEQKQNINWVMMGVVVGEAMGDIKIDENEVSEVRVFDLKSVKEISDKLTPNAQASLEYLNIMRRSYEKSDGSST